MLHIIMFTNDIVAVVKFVGDIRCCIDDLVIVAVVIFETVDKRLLELLCSFHLYSFVFHVVCEDETGIAHGGDVQRGKEYREPGYQL